MYIYTFLSLSLPLYLGCPGYRQLLPLVFKECDVVLVCNSFAEGEEGDWDTKLTNLPRLSIITKQDQPSFRHKAGLPTSAKTGQNVEEVFLLCLEMASKVTRPRSLQLSLGQAQADVRPSRLYSHSGTHCGGQPRLTPVPTPLSPTWESHRSQYLPYS